MGNWWRDFRYGLRSLGKAKSFTAIAILALALGIGPNIAIFSIIWATFFAPMPYPDADKIVGIQLKYDNEVIPVRADDFAQLEARAKSFQVMQYGSWMSLHLTNPDPTLTEDSGAGCTTGNVLQVPVVMGRYFLPDEGGPGKDHLVVLKHKLWVNGFHSDPHIIGKSILIDDQPYTVIGVWQAGVMDRIPNGVFVVPLKFSPGGHYQGVGGVDARLKPGVTVAQAQAEASAIFQQLLAKNGGDPHHQFSVSVMQLRNATLNQNLRRNLWLLLAAVGLVLMIACANVANLLLARGAARQQEIAVRSALGATRKQIFLQLLTESITLAILGGAIGVVLGWVCTKVTVALLPNMPSEPDVKLDLPVLCFAVGVALLSGIVFGCAPAWYATRMNLSDTLKRGSRQGTGRSRARTQGALVATEFALALTLLAGAGMALHSFWNLSRIDLGVRTDHLLTGFLRPRNRPAPDAPVLPPEQVAGNYRQIMEKISSLPGVENVALAMGSGTPLQGHGSFPFTIAGHPVADANRPTADFGVVTSSYFPTWGVRLIRGRFFNEGDTLTSPQVIMVSESFVHRYFPDVDPLSQGILVPVLTMNANHKMGDPVVHRIVGVFADVANGEHLADKNTPAMYAPYFQNPWPYAAISVRTAVDPLTLTGSLRATLSQSVPPLVLERPETMQEIVDKQLAGDRFSMALFGTFALLALFLAALGIYGVMAFAVTQRTQEIGVRMALGARRADVVLLMVRGGLRLALIGVAVGLAGAFALGRAFHSTLYGIGSVDYASLTAVAAVLLSVAVFASWVPARRAALVDPMVALRDQ